MLERLSFHVEQEMRSLSSIIKGGRTRDQGIFDFSVRVPQKVVVEEIYEDVVPQEEDITTMHHITSKIIEEKKAELEALEQQIASRIAEADQKVDEILSEAHAKAKAIEEEAKQQKEAILSAAYEKEKEVLASAEAELERIKNEGLQEKAEMLGQVEGEVVETMITLLSHIISDELTYHKDWLLLVVRKMLRRQDIEENATLLVSPKCYEALEVHKEKILQDIRKLSEIKSDESLNDSSCVLVTSQGNIEYDVRHGLEKVISELRILKSIS